MAKTGAFQTLLTRLEVPIDQDAEYRNDTYCNRDLIPIPPARRTYKIWSFVVYWIVSGACISAYSTGSSLLAYGLNAQQAMACVVVGGILSGLLAVVCGWMGEVHHIGFTVSSRFSWGMKLFYFPVVLRSFTSIFWFGIQAYWGGQAARVALGALIPGFAHMKNTIPLSSNITTNDLIGTLIWYIAYIPLVLVPPEKMQRPFLVTGIMFGMTLVGLLIWAVKNAGGGGPLFHTPQTTPNVGWSVMFGITSILGSWGAGTLGQSDWTRYAERRYAPTISQLVAAPVMITITALIGVVVTSASSEILGVLYWSPVELLGMIQEHYHSSPRVRAGVFFGGLGCFVSQLSINVVLNSVSTGMDVAGLWPRYINIRRGAYLNAALGVAACPWEILASAGTFLTVISGFGVFLAPLTGIMLADYLIVRKRILSIPDLYLGSRDSIYWYTAGCNFRAVLAWVLGVWPIMPGFVMTICDPTTDNNWVKLFNIAFIVGLSISFFATLAIAAVWPPPYQYVGLPYLDDAVPFGSAPGSKEAERVSAVGGDTKDEKRSGDEESL
ncbi:hypothetical protein PLICRDRAFT_45826 [Plicaturopsis crispa FD-325 SS-3]|uniref:NCS1 nucleoside transporter family protein n=1 Tax=Plicaturopsis crispa FD-325 SS-3 TaxID=944288 RepID=A0A0C9T6K5_PLICR|nr:hypothetical protein PLICRDRAFT_45826 [Plicaturopsis crispa FD-325 SS-3]